MKKDGNIIIRINTNLKNDFKNVINKDGYNASDVLVSFIRETVNSGLPSNLIKYLGPSCSKLSIPHIKKAVNKIVKMSFESKIKKVFLFGSYARGDETEKSDVDLLIETTSGFDLFNLGYLGELLEKELKKKVDIVTLQDLDKRFIDNIKGDEICIYE